MTRIKPYKTNPFYWDYDDQPTVLLGGSIEDNLFQIEGLKAHLDTLVDAGGNYVRCTMSSRDPGNVWPFEQTKTGLYDLNSPGQTYWQRFAHFLEACKERAIIVQIEIWDRFDFARDPWQDNPFNPKNTSNYSPEDSNLPETITTHPGQKENPFFRTVPKLENNKLVLNYQHAFVDKLLELSLPYGNILYCIDNETNESPHWSSYWADYLKKRAAEQDLAIQITEMWDAWDLNDPEHKATFDHPERYSFVDLSQNNHKAGLEHWQNPLSIREGIKASQRRPMNSVKIYGAHTGRYGSNRDAQERFWRCILAGFASARFHRPPSGLGLSELAQKHIKSMRMFLSDFPIFESTPGLELLNQRSWNEAYCAASKDAYAVFFTDGGEVLLETQKKQDYSIRWLNILINEWVATNYQTSNENGQLTLTTPASEGYWLALVQSSS